MKQTGKLTATSHKGDSSHKKVYLAFITAGKIKSSIKRPFKKAIIPSLPRSNTTLKKTLKKCPPLRLSKLLRVYILWKDNEIWLSMTGNLYQDETRYTMRKNLPKTLDQLIFCKYTLNALKFTKYLVNVHKIS